MITGGTDYNAWGHWLDDDDRNAPESYSKNFNAPKGVHIMNKNEHAMLRRLMAETGLSEFELRKEKKYRKMLSEAQKAKGIKTDGDRWIISMIKATLKETDKNIFDPVFKEALRKRIQAWIGKGYFRNPSYITGVEDMIRRYLELRKKQKND